MCSIGEKPFQPSHAGTAEAVIAVVLAVGALALLRYGASARAVAAVANGLAIGGFVVGLNFTVRGGGAIDIAYHAAVLPLLLLSLSALLLTMRYRTRGEKWEQSTCTSS